MSRTSTKGTYPGKGSGWKFYLAIGHRASATQNTWLRCWPGHPVARRPRHIGELSNASEAGETFEALGDRLGAIRLRAVQAQLDHDRGDYGDSRRILEEVVTLGRQLNQPTVLAVVLTVAAAAAVERGDFLAGQALAAESLQLARPARQPENVAWNLGTLGCLALSGGDEDLAEARFRGGLGAVRGLEVKGRRAIFLYGLALLARRKGQLGKAGEAIAEGFRLSRQQDWRAGMVRGLDLWAVLAATRSEHERAAGLTGACTAMGVWSRSLRYSYWQSRLRKSSVPIVRPADPDLARSRDEGWAMDL